MPEKCQAEGKIIVTSRISVGDGINDSYADLVISCPNILTKKCPLKSSMVGRGFKRFEGEKLEDVSERAMDYWQQHLNKCGRLNTQK